MSVILRPLGENEPGMMNIGKTAVKIFIFGLGLPLAVGMACSNGSQPSTTAAPETTESVTGLSDRPDFVPLITGPESPDGLQAILGTGDLAVGVNRLGFVLTTPKGFVIDPVVTVSTIYYANGDEGKIKQDNLQARLRLWPSGTRGLYVTQVNFDRPGKWGINIRTDRPGGSVLQAELFFQVADRASAPSVGALAPKSINKTLHDVDSIADLTTGSLHDPELYQITIAQAVSSGNPTVVVFASPAFCSNAVCGPQTEVLQKLKDKYRERANFIHVDFYDNPQEIQGDLDRARLSPLVKEWRLPSIEWTFVVDREGVITGRFEGFATFAEVEAILLDSL